MADIQEDPGWWDSFTSWLEEAFENLGLGGSVSITDSTHYEHHYDSTVIQNGDTTRFILHEVYDETNSWEIEIDVNGIPTWKKK